MKNARIRYRFCVAVRAVGLAVLVLAVWTSALVPDDSIMPMSKYSLGNGSDIYIPDGVSRVKAIWIEDFMGLATDAPSHNEAAMCHIWGTAYISMFRDGVTLAEQANFQIFFDNAASKSGHPEVANVPLIYTCGRWLADALMSQVKDKVLSATLFDAPGAAESLSKNTLALYFVYECGHESMVPNIASSATSVRSKGYPLCYYPVWGWTRGHFNGKSYAWPLFDWALRNILPQGQVPADGKMTLKAIDQTTGWLGDPSTWNGSWPMAYRYADYPKDKNGAPWIPDEYLARVWRATVAKHPTLMNKDNTTFGIMRCGTHADCTWGCSSPPALGAYGPLYVYNKVDFNPIVVPKDTTVRVRIACDYADMKEMKVYEGTQLIATLKPNAYRIWYANCTFSTPGVRAIIVEAELNSGEMVTSWPATVFVSNQATSVAPKADVAARPSSGLAVRSASRAAGGALRLALSVPEEQTLSVTLRDLKGRVLARPAQEQVFGAGSHAVTCAAPAASAFVVELRRADGAVVTGMTVVR